MGCQFFLQGIFPTRGSTLPWPPTVSCNSAEILLSTEEKIQTTLRTSETWPCLPSHCSPAQQPPHPSPQAAGITCCPLMAVHLPPLSGLTGLLTALSKQPPPCPALFSLCPCPRSLSTLQYSLAYVSLSPSSRAQAPGRLGLCLITTVSLYLETFCRQQRMNDAGENVLWCGCLGER